MQVEIDELVARFFGVFDNRDGRVPDFAAFDSLFVRGAVITVRNAGNVQVLSLADFVAPREKLLADGSLTHFHEWELESETFLSGGIASRTCKYRKEGTMNELPYTGQGTKCFHFVRTDSGWRIASVLWEDSDAAIR
jgi:hypothetical protein